MNYLKEYYSIIKNRKYNIILDSENGENHHITPRSFFICGESNEIINHSDNLVRLTEEEHFLVHYYLYKHYEINFRHTTFYYKAILGFKAMGLSETKDSNRFMNAKLYEEGNNSLREYNKELNINNIKDICEFVNKNNKIPYIHSIIKEERSLSGKLNNLRQNKKNNKNWYECYDELILNYGFPNLFITRDFEEEVLEKMKDLFDFIKNKERIPIKNTEIVLFNFYHRLRRNKINNKNWYECYDIMIKEYNMEKYFLISSNEDKMLSKIEVLCDFLDLHKRKPKRSKVDKEENRLFNLINELKKKKNGTAIRGLWCGSYQDLIEERGYNDLF